MDRCGSTVTGFCAGSRRSGCEARSTSFLAAPSGSWRDCVAVPAKNRTRIEGRTDGQDQAAADDRHAARRQSAAGRKAGAVAEEAEMTRAEAREEIYAARELARRREAAKSIEQIIREVRRPEHPLSDGRMRSPSVDADLAERIAWARSFKPLPLPEPEPAAPRFLTYVQRGPRWTSFRTVAVPPPPKPPRTDSWGRPKW